MHSMLSIAILGVVLAVTGQQSQAQSFEDVQSRTDKIIFQQNETRAKVLVEAWKNSPKMQQNFGQPPNVDAVGRILSANGQIPFVAAKPVSEYEIAMSMYKTGALNNRFKPEEFAALLKKVKEYCPGCDVAPPGTSPPGCPKK